MLCPKKKKKKLSSRISAKPKIAIRLTDGVGVRLEDSHGAGEEVGLCPDGPAAARPARERRGRVRTSGKATGRRRLHGQQRRSFVCFLMERARESLKNKKSLFFECWMSLHRLRLVVCKEKRSHRLTSRTETEQKPVARDEVEVTRLGSNVSLSSSSSTTNDKWNDPTSLCCVVSFECRL